jgi:hypothetical protein
MAGYRLPGTTITEVTQPSSINISSTQRIPCFIGVASDYVKVKYEEVIRSSTGLADDLAYTSYGIYSISSIGSQKGLSDFTEGTDYNLTGDQVVWTSSGIVTIGATYFVTYYYNRPYDGDNLTDTDLNDYRYKEFYRFEDVVADLGSDIPDHPLVNIAKLALRTYGVPKIAVVQVRDATVSSYTDALSLIKYRDVQTVCALTTNSSVRTLVVNHVLERSIPDNARYRMAWFGAATGTEIGDESDLTSIRGITASIKKERAVFINATRAKYYYIDPTTNTETYTTVDGSFIAAAIAAYRDSFTFPATTLLNKQIPGLELYDEDYDDYYSELMLKYAGSSSVFIVDSVGGTLRVRDDMTTDNTTVERNNINIITAKDYIADDVAYQMNTTFHGQLILDRSSYQNTVQAYLASLFATYKQAKIIEDIGTLKAQIDDTNKTKVNIYYSYYAVYTHKLTDGEFALEV